MNRLILILFIILISIVNTYSYEEILSQQKFANEMYLEFYNLYSEELFLNLSSIQEKNINHLDSLNYNNSTSNEIEQIYDGFIQRGSYSLTDAKIVSLASSELSLAILININDSKNEFIIINSRNQIRVLNEELKILNISYSPQFISNEEFSPIINSEIEIYENNSILNMIKSFFSKLFNL